MTDSPEIPRIYRECFTVRHSEGDRDGVLKLRALFDYLQEAAANHAALLGVGMGALQKKELLWVLSRIRIRILRTAEIGDTLEVETYPSGFQRLFANRQYQVRGGNGEVFAQASSQWMLLSALRLRPVRPSEMLGIALPENTDMPVFFPALEKPRKCEGRPLFSDAVRESRIDVNRHLNNAEYAALAQDALHALNFPAKEIGEIQIQFQSAAKEGETILVHGESDGTKFLLTGLDSGGAVRFECDGFRR